MTRSHDPVVLTHCWCIIVACLNESVGDLSAQVGHQKELTERLTSSLQSQKNLLNDVILKSRAEVERQCALIDRQQAIVQVGITLNSLVMFPYTEYLIGDRFAWINKHTLNTQTLTDSKPISSCWI